MVADPGVADLQRDLAVSHNKIGDVRRARGDLAGAETSHRAALKIAESLAALDPTNATWQRDLAVSCQRMAFLHQDSGNAAEARAWLIRCRDVLRGMRDRGMHLAPPIAQVLEQLERLPRD